jgi:hypothetical protein
MRLSLILAVCAAFIFAVSANVSVAQTGTKPSKESTTAQGGKSAAACHKCCSDNQAKMGGSPRQIEVCVQRCIIGTARNC